MKALLLALCLLPTLLFSQSRKERKALEAQQKADQVVIINLKSHVQNLLVKPGSAPGGIDYISAQFKAIGLQPKGTNGFIQPFVVDDGKRIEPTSFLKVNDNLLEINKEYFPLPYSAEKKVKGMPAMALRERGVPWFVDVKDWLDAQRSLDEAIKKEAAKNASKGATAIFLYNSGSVADALVFNKKDKSSNLTIPVIYITPEGYKKYFTDHSQVLDIELNVAFKENNITGSNVTGYIDNAAPSTIVIAAHYNLSSDAYTKIVNGADDNCSGAAMLIELARMLATSKAKSNNYLFLALGGDDQGVTAAKYWLENSATGLAINYLINLDMVGSYSEGKKLLVQGYNSSPLWSTVFTSIPEKKLEMSVDSTRTIAEAYSSFNQKGIPVLSFSSASHSDYVNKPDEEGKINYAGELQIAKFITKLIEAADTKGKLSLAKAELTARAVNSVTKTSIQSETKTGVAVEQPVLASKTTVSLGVIPDKTISEDGLRISGVTPKKLASKLGLQPGDILTNLGSYKISDFKSYLNALANFKAGDKITLRIKRGKDDKEFAVEF